jgi:hypothetical protein
MAYVALWDLTTVQFVLLATQGNLKQTINIKVHIVKTDHECGWFMTYSTAK